MYELKKLITFANDQAKDGKKLALATIIKTVGSSYRKTGTQMIVAENLAYEGALSGGCVENETLRQAEKVFREKRNVIFEYDGQYKLGCNGKIYVLIEPLELAQVSQLSENFHHHHSHRIPFQMKIKKDRLLTTASLSYVFAEKEIVISEPVSGFDYDDAAILPIDPQYQLVIVGGEFDSVNLAEMANATGYQVHLVVKESFTRKVSQAIKVGYVKPEELRSSVKFDRQTAVVLMTHSLSKDLNYLVELLNTDYGYLGILGPPSRKETILSNLMNYNEALFFAHGDKIESIYGPVGLNIGARTPEEISVSILSEIISVFNNKALKPLFES